MSLGSDRNRCRTFNNSFGDAHNVQVYLSVNDPDITITDFDRGYGDILAGNFESSPDFDFEVSSNCPDKDVEFTL
ncbi:MAG: hypothetical protein IPK10_15900 [Bacteroidetes bacterium]|nr:hypothetical protein [Bacteroidota bacterium]